MINYTIGVDTLSLQIDFTNNNQQQEVMYNIINALLSSYNLQISYNTNKYKKALLVHSIYTAGKKILKLKSGTYCKRFNNESKGLIIYYSPNKQS